jgi:hypothetical protein
MILGLIETKTQRSDDAGDEPPAKRQPQPDQKTELQSATGSGVFGGNNRFNGNAVIRQRLPIPSIFAAQNAPSAGKSSSGNRSLDQQLLDDLDRELLKGLPTGPKPAPPKTSDDRQPKPDGQEPPPTSQNPLAQIAEQMRSVERRIARRDTSAETQEQQSAIVSRLQALLDQAGSSGNKQSGGGSAQQGVGTGEAVAGPPRDSTNRIERGTAEQVETTDVKELVRRMWGHLPPKVRDEMQTSLSENFLPKYERLIEEYYKRLAEERPGRP